MNDKLPDSRDYDALTIRIMARVLDKDSCCVDIGCHMGEILKEMMALAPDGTFYGFEPIPLLAQYLQKSYAGDNVHIFATALSDRQGESEFNLVDSNPAYSGLVKRRYDRPDEKDSKIQVPVDTIDNIFADINVDFIKIDVEGGELQVLKGGRSVIARDKPVIVFEHGLGAADCYGTQPADIFEVLVSECGLSIYNLHTYLAGDAPLDADELTRQFDNNEHYYFVAA